MRFSRTPLSALLALIWGSSNPLFANPVGENVIAGSATFQRGANTLIVKQTTDRAIVNWQSFSIGASELTRFIQPSASAAILNRVVSGDPSSLLGRLEANGRVFLINPNGILVGGGAVIDTNGFIASTLNVRDAQFMAGGDLNFFGDSRSGVLNLGTIKAQGGDVYLIAHTVENAGVIDAPNGVVGLAAGTEVLLKHAGDERLIVKSSVTGQPLAATGVDNTGIITAVQAELRAAGGNVYALAINNSGAVHATGVALQDGRVFLTSPGGNIQNSGTLAARDAAGNGGKVVIAAGADSTTDVFATNSGVIDASGKSTGARGGTVTITGDHVSLAGAALVDASGDAGGGSVLLGGDYQGRNPDVQNARAASVSSGSRIVADAVTRGDGGKVVVWSDKSTTFDGTISARGGAKAGNGGVVETSGKVLVVGSEARVDASAANGLPGNWLLDPFNITVVNSFPGDGNFSGGNPNVVTANGNDSTVDAGTISTALTNGTSVTIRTSDPAQPPAGAQLGNIQVNASISVNIPQNSATPVPTLQLDADNQIIINAAIQGNFGSKGLNLTANAKDAITVTSQGNLLSIRNGIFNAGTKNPALASSGGITITGSINSIVNDPADKFTLKAAGDITGAGTLQAVNVDLNSSAGSVNFGGRLQANLLTAAAPTGSITINNASGVNVNFLGGVSSGGAVNIRNTGSGGSALNVVGSVVAGGGNPLSITTVGTLFIDSKGEFGKGTGSLTDATGTVMLNARDVSDAINPLAPSIIAAALGIAAQQGIGANAANPLDTSVSNLAATSTSNGIFIKNTGKELTIGGISTFAVGGVLTGLNTGGQIQIVNDRSILLTVANPEQAHVAGPQNILIQANGANSDILIGDNSANAVNAHAGSVTLNAGRDVVIGNGTTGQRGDITGDGGITIVAGHALVVDEGSFVTAGGSGGINVSAGVGVPLDPNRPPAIVFFQTSAQGARLATSGGPINLTTGPGGFVDAHSGPGVTAINSFNTGSGGGGLINITTDDVRLSSRINAGPNFVQFLPASATQAFDLGSETAGKFSLTNAELNLVSAGTVVVGNAANRTDVRVTAPIALTGVNALGIQALGTGGGDNMIAASVTVPTFEIQATNAITGQGAINASDRLTLTSDNGNIVLSGPVQTNALVVPGAGLISLESLGNRISFLGDIQRRGPVTIRNTIPLTIHGVIGGSNTNNDVTIRTVGDITLNGPGAAGFSGANVVVSGAGNQIVLEAFNGRFINNAGSQALRPLSGARFRVYSQDQQVPFNAGGLVGDLFLTRNVTFNADPGVPANNVFYFQNVGQPVMPPPSDTAGVAINATLFEPTLRRFTVLSMGESLIDFQARMDAMTQRQLNALADDESLKSDEERQLMIRDALIKRSGIVVRESARATPAELRTRERVAQQQKLELNERRIVEAKLTAFRILLPPGSYTQEVEDALLGRNTIRSTAAGYFDVLSLTLDQIAELNGAQMLRILAIKGVKLSPRDRLVVATTSVTSQQFSNMVRAGEDGVLTRAQFSTLVAAGAGNLTIAQLVAAGAGNVVSNDSAGFKVLGRDGRVISNDGASLTLNQLANLITNDGGTLITNDGGSLITNDGGSLITNDGGSLITNDGGSLITNDGGTLIASIASLVVRSAAQIVAVNNLISQDGAGLISQDGAGLISQDGAGLISRGGPGIISGNGSAIISGNGSAIISGNGSAVLGSRPSGNGFVVNTGR